MGNRRARSRLVGASLGRLVVLLTALLGLFAMHGMSDHGTSGHAAMGTVTTAHHGLAGGEMVPVAGREPVTSTGSSSLGHAALDLCLALLGTGVLLWLTRAIGRSTVSRLAAAVVGRGITARARAPDPPDLIRLAIQRC